MPSLFSYVNYSGSSHSGSQPRDDLSLTYPDSNAVNVNPPSLFPPDLSKSADQHTANKNLVLDSLARRGE